MIITMKKVELLAPAGNYESFMGAIQAGADAVYLGGTKFGARAYADNFHTEELCRAIVYAHLQKRKVYLTLNTLVKEQEMQELYAYLLPFYEVGLDGVIVQDIGVFLYVRKHFPNLELHVSTQMTITGVYGAKWLKEMGACRIVPARELSLKEIMTLKQEADIEVETFIHGAMCYCYSGQCLFSSMLGGRSGNRGKCAQPCRLPYQVTENGRLEKPAYLLSLKDMCTIEHIPELIEAGIDSFKIEGRMKKPEYAAGVTAIYRKYIDAYESNPKGKFCVDQEDLEQLKSLYIRSGLQDGYYHKHNGAQMITMSAPSYNGNDENLLEEIRNRYLTHVNKIAISVTGEFAVGLPAKVTFQSGDIKATIVGDVVEEAVKQPIMEENIRKQLEKVGNTFFEVEHLSVVIQGNGFFPLKSINKLRRQAAARLEEKLLRMYAPEVWGRQAVVPEQNAITDAKPKGEKKGAVQELSLLVRSKEQFQAVESYVSRITRVYIDCDLFNNVSDWEKELSSWKEKEEKLQILIAMPYIVRTSDTTFLERMWQVLQLPMVDGMLVRNLETLSYYKEKGYDKKFFTDAGIYIWNRQTETYWQNQADFSTMPYELNRKEQNTLECCRMEKVIYGRIPMMVTANCITKTKGKCKKMFTENPQWGRMIKSELMDRYRKTFPVFCCCSHCYNVIWNSLPLSLHEVFARSKEKAAAYRLEFTTESGEETKAIIEFFLAQKACFKKDRIPPYTAYTTGLEKREAE